MNLTPNVLSDHPLIAAWLGLFFLLVLLLGVLHVCRIFGQCLIVIVREVKHELSGGRDVLRDLLKEFTKEESDP